MPTFVTKRIKSLDLNGKPRKEKSLCWFHFFACENLSAYFAISICISNLSSVDCGLSRSAKPLHSLFRNLLKATCNRS